MERVRHPDFIDWNRVDATLNEFFLNQPHVQFIIELLASTLYRVTRPKRKDAIRFLDRI